MDLLKICTQMAVTLHMGNSPTPYIICKQSVAEPGWRGAKRVAELMNNPLVGVQLRRCDGTSAHGCNCKGGCCTFLSNSKSRIGCNAKPYFMHFSLLVTDVMRFRVSREERGVAKFAKYRLGFR